MSASWKHFNEQRSKGYEFIESGIQIETSWKQNPNVQIKDEDLKCVLDLYRAGVDALKRALEVPFPETERKASTEAKEKLKGTIASASKGIHELEQRVRPPPSFVDRVFSSWFSSSPPANPSTPAKPSTASSSLSTTQSLPQRSQSQSTFTSAAKPETKETRRSSSHNSFAPNPRPAQHSPAVNNPASPQVKKQPAKPKKADATEDELTQHILSEIVDSKKPISWDDVGGLSEAKRLLYESLILPSKRPDLFVGLRSPPKGLLLFGPPGNGKTMLARAAASQAGCTFFSISASSLSSKWYGEGEKLVKALFSVARTKQPALIFIDEIDSLLSERSGGEHDASRRVKTEFLVQMDGAAVDSGDRVFVMGATNRPQDLDEAVRRRLAHRIYVPLPEKETRLAILTNLLKSVPHKLSASDCDKIVAKLDGYSGSDIAMVCKDAAFGPIRECGPKQLEDPKLKAVRPVEYKDFENSLARIRPSVSKESLIFFESWNKDFGSQSFA